MTPFVDPTSGSGAHYYLSYIMGCHYRARPLDVNPPQVQGLCLFFTGFCFWIPADSPARVGCVATGIYLFMVGYSPGMGSVPFTYSAESYPLVVRDTGMSFTTATCWGFKFILALTWPALVKTFTPQDAFSWYAAWNLFGFVFTWFCLPETKERPLEELDAGFGIRIRDQFKYYLNKTSIVSKGHASNDDQDLARVIGGKDVAGQV